MLDRFPLYGRRLALALALVPLLGLLAAPAAAEDDAELVSFRLGLRVRLALLDKLGVDAVRVDVAAREGGAVHLTGVVKKRATAELAADVARQVPGVTKVSDDLKVQEYEETREKSAVVAAEAERELKDAALEVKVRVALVEQLGRDGFRIGTDAASGVVSLELPAGLAPERRRQAVEIASKVNGVEKVIELEKRK